MIDRRVNPLDVEEVMDPPNEHWAAKRELADEFRTMADLLMTSTPAPEDLRRISQYLRQQRAVFEESPRTFGRMEFYRQENQSPYVHIEMNPLCGHGNPIAPPVNSWLKDDEAYGSVNMGWQYEGPPGSVHGGFIAAVFDDFLGMAQRLTNSPGMTGTLTVRYRKPTPLNTDLKLHGYVKSSEGRKNVLVGTMHADGVLTAECEGLFIGFPKEAMRQYIEQQPR
ncbi:MAG: PaaI family thioesterase [Pseudomonadota bacterium]